MLLLWMLIVVLRLKLKLLLSKSKKVLSFRFNVQQFLSLNCFK